MLFLSACATPASGTATSTAPLVSPLDSPLATKIPVIDVTEDASLGKVSGTIQLKAGDTAKPIAGRSLYLAKLTKDASGQDTGAGLDRVNSPRAVSIEDGSFVFKNVPAGRYALIMDLVSNAYMLRKPDGSGDLITDVMTGETTALGILVYTELPR